MVTTKSLSIVEISAGRKVFSYTPTFFLPLVGDTIRAHAARSPAFFVEGLVTRTESGWAEISVASRVGAGVFNSWNLTLTPAALEVLDSLIGTGPQGPQGPEGVAGAAGVAGVDGATGATGTAGINGVNGVDGAPGADGTDAALILSIVEKNLGNLPTRSGTFDIAGLLGLTPGKPVFVTQAAVVPYTNEYTVTATGYVADATTIRVYWDSHTPVTGNRKFQYMVSA